jgi:hypothetical protein
VALHRVGANGIFRRQQYHNPARPTGSARTGIRRYHSVIGAPVTYATLDHAAPPPTVQCDPRTLLCPWCRGVFRRLNVRSTALLLTICGERTCRRHVLILAYFDLDDTALSVAVGVGLTPDEYRECLHLDAAKLHERAGLDISVVRGQSAA